LLFDNNTVIIINMSEIGDLNIIYIITVLIVILISMTMHEAMHAYTSYWLGDDTARLQGRLTINPIKHIDPFMTILLPLILAMSGAPVFGGAKPVPFNPNKIRGDEWGIAMVAIAGPITNFLIAFVVFGIWALVNPQIEIINQFFVTAVYVNLGFFIFNMIPIPPLDGSRVLYALAPDFAKKVMEKIESFGVMIVFAFVLIASPLLMRFMSDTMSLIFNLFLFIFGF